MVQWVTGTTGLRDFIVKQKMAKYSRSQKHYPDDISYEAAREIMQSARTGKQTPAEASVENTDFRNSLVLNERLLKAFQHVCRNYHPIMALRLLEVFPSPELWLVCLNKPVV